MEFIKINGRLINSRYIVAVTNNATSVIISMSNESPFSTIDVDWLKGKENEKKSAIDLCKEKFDEIEIALTPDPLQVEILNLEEIESALQSIGNVIEGR